MLTARAAIIRGVFLTALLASVVTAQTKLQLNEREYFEMSGVNVMVFQNIYPEGHQGGVNIIQNGVRVASNGDLRLSPTPGQWQPIPKQDKRVVNREGKEIVVSLSYPDQSRNRKGFNPIDYRDLNLAYNVRVRGDGPAVRVIVDLNQPLPPARFASVCGDIAVAVSTKESSAFGRPGSCPDR